MKAVILNVTFSFCLFSLPIAATDREQLKIELQQVNQQISQQTQMRSMEVWISINDELEY